MTKTRNAEDELKIYGETLEGIDFKIVTLHPLANETNTLSSLGIKPEDCTHCDLYWLYANTLFFVSISSDSQQGNYAVFHRKPGSQNGKSFFIKAMETPLYLKQIEQILRSLSSWIDENRDLVFSSEIPGNGIGFYLDDA